MISEICMVCSLWLPACFPPVYMPPPPSLSISLSLSLFLVPLFTQYLYPHSHSSNYHTISLNVIRCRINGASFNMFVALTHRLFVLPNVFVRSSFLRPSGAPASLVILRSMMWSSAQPAALKPVCITILMSLIFPSFNFFFLHSCRTLDQSCWHVLSWLSQDPLPMLFWPFLVVPPFFLFQRCWKNVKNDPTVCASAVVTTLEAQKCRKKTPRAVRIVVYNESQQTETVFAERKKNGRSTKVASIVSVFAPGLSSGPSKLSNFLPLFQLWKTITKS